jgi:hypothetical protein
VEEAFYVVLVDARSWSMASETISKASVVASLEDEVEKAEIPRVRQDLGDELERVKNLTEMLGGEDELNSLYATAELI